MFIDLFKMKCKIKPATYEYGAVSITDHVMRVDVVYGFSTVVVNYTAILCICFQIGLTEICRNKKVTLTGCCVDVFILHLTFCWNA